MKNKINREIDNYINCGFTGDSIFGFMPSETTPYRMIEVQRIHENPRNPYQVNDDDLGELKDSVAQMGILTPLMVRKKQDNEYELLSGHRRLKVANILGLHEVPVIIKECTDDEADILIVDSNLYREKILISEKAKAYRMKYLAMKNQGKQGDSLEIMTKETEESRKTLQRYIKLGELSDCLLEMVDEKQIPFVAGVDIVELKPQELNILEKILVETKIRLTNKKAVQLKMLSQESTKPLVEKEIRSVLTDKKEIERKDNVLVRLADVHAVIGDKYTVNELREKIMEYIATLK